MAVLVRAFAPHGAMASSVTGTRDALPVILCISHGLGVAPSDGPDPQPGTPSDDDMAAQTCLCAVTIAATLAGEWPIERPLDLVGSNLGRSKSLAPACFADPAHLPRGPPAGTRA